MSRDGEAQVAVPPFKHPDFVWPTLRTRTIELRHMPDISIDASVSVDTGRPIVDFRIDGRDEETLTPVEARRVAVVLVRAADCCDAKSAAARAWRSSPVVEEAAPRHTLAPRARTEAKAKAKAKTKTKTKTRGRGPTRPASSHHPADTACEPDHFEHERPGREE